MKRYRIVGLAVLVAVVATAALMFASLGSAKPAATMDKVTLQLKWVPQAQFAGYYAAASKGYYKQFGLDVTLKPGGPDITPEQVVASGQAQFGLDWLPSLLATRDKGGDLVNIAQVFTRSGHDGADVEVERDQHDQEDGRQEGRRLVLRQRERAVRGAREERDRPEELEARVTIVNQPFDMTLFLQNKVDAAAAMTYNELAQVLETKNPQTGKLYTLNELNVITMERAGTAMLEDGVFAQGSWLKDAKNQDIAKRFLAASFKGWAYCRDHHTECVNIVLKAGTTLGRGHQTWQMNEINKLIWPAPVRGVGVMNPVAFARTAAIAKQFKVIAKAPSAGTYRTDLAKAANAMLRKQGVNTTGLTWKAAVVKVTAGGK